MEIRIRDVPAESRAAAMEFVNEYEAGYMAGRKPGMANGKGWVSGSGKAIIMTFLPLTKQSI